MGAVMDNINGMSEKVESLKSYLQKYAKEYVEKNNKFRLHIERLQRYISINEENAETEGLREMLVFLKETQVEYTNTLQQIHSLLDVLNAITLLYQDVDNDKSCKGLQILDVQEKERDRIARELHDSTVQDLTAVIFKVELCTRYLDKDITKVRLELQLIICSLKKVIEDMRVTIRELKPIGIGDESLDSSIRKYMNGLAITYKNIRFDFASSGQKIHMKSVYEITLLRIVQEACQNAVKHSRASCIQVRLNIIEDRVSLRIIDNGIGFDISEAKREDNAGGHFGLTIMKERAELMGAEFEINSTKEKGTIVTVGVTNVYSDEGDLDVAD